MAISEKDLSDREFQMLQLRMQDYDKSHLLAYLMFFFFGFFGIHKFYIGKIFMGILYNVLCLLSVVMFFFILDESEPDFLLLISPLLLGLLLLYDLFTIPFQIRRVKKRKKRRLVKKIKREA